MLDSAFVTSNPVAVATTSSHEHICGECAALLSALCLCATGAANQQMDSWDKQLFVWRRMW